jgi:predicted amidohydrolase YtcJ
MDRADNRDDTTGVASGMKRCAIHTRVRSEMQRATSLEDHIRNCRPRAAQRGWTLLVGDGGSERRGSRITTREQDSDAAWRVPACQRRLVQPRLLADEPRTA